MDVHIVQVVLLLAGLALTTAQVEDVLARLGSPVQIISDGPRAVNQGVKKCSTTPTDIVFLLDSSSSEGVNHFNEQIDFIYNITNNFDIGPQKVQVSVVTFAEVAYNEFFLDDYKTKAGLLAAIKNIIYRPGNTNTHLGLDFVFHNSFLSIHGGRNTSDKVIVVLTDGKSSDAIQTAQVANLIHSTNIRVISIGIGASIDRTELATIATDIRHMYVVANFSSLSNIVVDVTSKTCLTEELLCRSTPVDILFLVDSSSNTGSANFNTELDFVKNFTKEFDIGPTMVQVALATFSDTTKSEFSFKDYTNKSDVLNAISSATFRPGGTHTDKALRFAREEGFLPKNGARANVKHVIVILTNGQSADKSATKLEAVSIHNANIDVIAIGIGTQVDQSELKLIATGNGDENYFAVSNFDALFTIEVPIQQETCRVCDTKPSDVVFLLDASSSEGIDNFNKQLEFVNSFARQLVIGPNKVQISIVTFSNDAYEEFPLNKYSDKATLLQAILNVPYRPGDTQTDNGLRFVTEQSFLQTHGARRNANKIVIVVTDGQSTDPTSTSAAAQVLHQQAIKVIAVGIGIGIDTTELNIIATDKKNVFTVVGFDALLQIENVIIETTCQAKIRECSLTPTDIVLLLDSSTSEGSVNFRKQLDFASNFVDGFDIGPNTVQFSLVTFASTVINRFFLDDFRSNAAVKAAISRTPYTSGLTHTGDGLEFVRKISLSPIYGARPGSKKVVIVMTDGQSQQKLLTANEGILLRKEGVMVISIGVGQNVNIPELAVIASDDKHMFQVSGFDDLNNLETKLHDSVCANLVCASTPADIAFVMDSSASIGPANFQDMLDFAANFVKKFDIGTSAVQFSMISFSDKVYPQFDFGQYADRASVISGIKKVQSTFGETYTEKALRYLRLSTFSPTHGARIEAAKVAIILTDGHSHSSAQTLAEADALHKAGISTIAVGIGRGVNLPELASIANNRSYVFSVATFNALETIQAELLQATCSSVGPKPTRPPKVGPCGGNQTADVLFLVDSSNSEGLAGFPRELEFVEQFVNNFPIGPDDYQFGLIKFASSASLDIPLNISEKELRLAILQVAYGGGLTYTDEALRLARTEGFQPANGARPGVRRFAIVITDGPSTAKLFTIREAGALRNENVHIIAIGIGKDHDLPDTLQNLASDPGSVFLVQSFAALTTAIPQIEQKLCVSQASSTVVPVTSPTV